MKEGSSASKGDALATRSGSLSGIDLPTTSPIPARASPLVAPPLLELLVLEPSCYDTAPTTAAGAAIESDIVHRGGLVLPRQCKRTTVLLCGLHLPESHEELYLQTNEKARFVVRAARHKLACFSILQCIVPFVSLCWLRFVVERAALLGTQSFASTLWGYSESGLRWLFQHNQQHRQHNNQAPPCHFPLTRDVPIKTAVCNLTWSP